MFDYRISLVCEDVEMWKDTADHYYGIFYDPIGNGTDWELVSKHGTIQDAAKELIRLDSAAVVSLTAEELDQIPF